MNVDMAIYRCFRSNALWFSGRSDGYSVSTRNITVSFDKGEMRKRALEWLEKSRAYWDKLQLAHAVSDSCTGLNAGNTTDAASADSPAGVECICPNCTRATIDKRVASHPKKGE